MAADAAAASEDEDEGMSTTWTVLDRRLECGGQFSQVRGTPSIAQ